MTYDHFFTSIMAVLITLKKGEHFSVLAYVRFHIEKVVLFLPFIQMFGIVIFHGA